MTCGKKHCDNAPTEATKVDPAEVEGRPLCDHPGCDKRVVGDGTRCADGHVQGTGCASELAQYLVANYAPQIAQADGQDQATALLALAPIPLPECAVPQAEEGRVVEVAGVYAPLIAVAREHGFHISKMIVGNGNHVALALNNRSGSYWATYLRFDPRTKRLYSGSGYSVRTQWYQARRDMGHALRSTAADQKAAGRALIEAVKRFGEADEWPFDEWPFEEP